LPAGTAIRGVPPNAQIVLILGKKSKTSTGGPRNP